jgi:hypothetical protein
MTLMIEYAHAVTNAFGSGFGFGATVVGICLQVLAFLFGLVALISTAIVAFSILQLCGIRTLEYAVGNMLTGEEVALKALLQARSAITQFRRHVMTMRALEILAHRDGKSAEPSATGATALERAKELYATARTMVEQRRFTEAWAQCLQISALCRVEEVPPSLLELIGHNFTAVDDFLVDMSS